MQLNKLAATLAAVGLAAPGLAMATNGMIMEGYGPIAAGMGGASLAHEHGNGQGGMGTEYANGDMAQVSVGRVIFPVAYSVNDRLNVGGSVDFVWAGMDLAVSGC